MMKVYLLIDFGSTFTKFTVVDVDQMCLVGTLKTETTRENLLFGYQRGLERVFEQYGHLGIEVVRQLGCSSALGGLKMITIGLTPELTSEAAKIAALGAGARVLKRYHHEMTREDVVEISTLDPDIILLTGGTDGGNKETIIKNAERLAKANVKCPIVVAGNRNAYEEIKALFKAYKIDSYFTSNVMPRLNVLELESVNQLIRNIFMETITKAKGMESVEQLLDDPLIPTPAAVLNSVRLLSEGTDNECGLGEFVLIDIGGATTDIYSAAKGHPSKASIIKKGLDEPYYKRTVEGDLGMRVSAKALLESVGYSVVKKHFEAEPEYIEGQCEKRAHQINYISANEHDLKFDYALATVAISLAIERHVGKIESYFFSSGRLTALHGKDLTHIPMVIGTGGVLTTNQEAFTIIQNAIQGLLEKDVFAPIKANIFLDKDYIFSAIGLLSQYEPQMALMLLKRHMVLESKKS